MLLKVDDKCVEQWIDLLDGKRKVEKEILKEIVLCGRKLIADSRAEHKRNLTKRRK